MKRLLFVLVGLLLAGCARERPLRVEWTTMGTVAAVQWRASRKVADTAPAPQVKAVRNAFADVERLLNAHDPASEIRRLAPLGEQEILARCDGSVSNCYAAAFRLMRESGGAFNPRWRGPGTLDLGAIAKGFAVDRAVQSAGGAPGDFLIDLGGNLRSLRGDWKVGVAASDRVLVLTNGMACATSAEYFRGKHIRDGRTGSVVTNGLVSVTVVHPTSAMLADGLSTVLFILGRTEGEKFLRKNHPEATAVWVCR